MWRVIDIEGSQYFLHFSDNNLIVEKEQSVVGKIPFDDIHSIVCHGIGCRYSDAFLKACMERRIPITFCDEKHVPLGMLLSVSPHTEYWERQGIQMHATVPRKKQAWQQIVSQKLKNQCSVLGWLGCTTGRETLDYLQRSVRSGDPDNKEAQGAREYFKTLFGNEFSRSDDNAINSFLNYGYTILRSAVARAVVGCGLLPSLGVFHSPKQNAFCLVDDLMEPLRQMVDIVVLRKAREGFSPYFSSGQKKEFMALTQQPVYYEAQHTELSNALTLYILSYIRFLARESESLVFPNYHEMMR
jgi:CRISPR-associated protein Cas1